MNIIVEGSTEEAFVNDVLASHFAEIKIFISARKITTSWDGLNNKPAKGGLSKYIKFRNEVVNWITSDRNRRTCWYTSMIDLYAFPTDDRSPYTSEIQNIVDP